MMLKRSINAENLNNKKTRCGHTVHISRLSTTAITNQF